ncbi:hypothetical protein HYU92_02145 [Candidatus Curtissbacteria bacterium]|nr:hypothetical protein [Candidatus Curtissbacteria bacterium]
MGKRFLYLIATVLVAIFLEAAPVFAYHSEVSVDLLGFSYKLSQDTHSEITNLAYSVGNIAINDYPDLVKGDLKAEIFMGDSDEAMSHQGSDKLAIDAKVGGGQNEFAWFGAPDLHWKQVLADYKNKKFKEAYHRIGVLLHLTEDATVPAHVRIAPHGRGSEEYFGTGKSSRSDAQPTYKNNRIPPGISLIDTVGDDLFEQVVENMAAKKQIRILANKPILLSSVDVYMMATRDIVKKYLDSDSYWDQYWQKNNSFSTWGRYGAGGNNFGKGAKVLGSKESLLVTFVFNTAIANTAGQLQVISKKLPPIAEDLFFAPNKFDEQGTKINFTVLENRTRAVKIKLTVGSENGPSIIDEAGQIYDGKSNFDLVENQGSFKLPYRKTFAVSWKGETTGGKIKAGSQKVTLAVVDGDGNPSEITSGDFEYLKADKKSLVDEAKKAPAGGKAPVIDRVDNSQLHGSYEETPHRYLLQAQARDPEGGQLTYTWSINCGYFAGTLNGSQIEWRYNTPGECVDAVVTVTVKDSDDLITKKSQAVF